MHGQQNIKKKKYHLCVNTDAATSRVNTDAATSRVNTDAATSRVNTCCYKPC